MKVFRCIMIICLASLLFACDELVTMNNFAEISGKVQMVAGSISPTEVKIMLDSGTMTAPDMAGNFAFKHILPGDYTLKISALGYSELSLDLQLSKGQNLILDPQTLEKLSSVYVSPDGSDSNSGLAPDKAVQTISRSIEVARENRLYEILLRNGNYTVSNKLEIDFPVAIHGSFDNTWNRALIETNPVQVMHPDYVRTEITTVITGHHQLFEFFSKAQDVRMSHLRLIPGNAPKTSGNIHFDQTSTAINAYHINFLGIWNTEIVYPSDTQYWRICALDLRGIAGFYFFHSDITGTSSTQESFGIHLEQDNNAYIVNSKILLDGSTQSSSKGIVLRGKSNATIVATEVHGGAANNWAVGIEQVENSMTDIQYCAVSSGASVDAWSVALSNGGFSTARIDSSTFTAASAANQSIGLSGYGFSETDIRNSDFFGGHGTDFSGGIKIHDYGRLKVRQSTSKGGLANNFVSVGIGLFHFASALIDGNDIDAGECTSGWQAGIEINGQSSAMIINNTISDGSGNPAQGKHSIWIGPNSGNVFWEGNDLSGGELTDNR